MNNGAWPDTHTHTHMYVHQHVHTQVSVQASVNWREFPVWFTQTVGPNYTAFVAFCDQFVPWSEYTRAWWTSLSTTAAVLCDHPFLYRSLDLSWLMAGKVGSPHSFSSMITVSSGKHYYWVRFVASVLSHCLLLMSLRLFHVFLTDICKFLEPKRLHVLKMNLHVQGMNVYDSFIHPVNHRLTESTVIEWTKELKLTTDENNHELNWNITDLQSRHNVYFLTLNNYMFWIEKFIIGLIQDLITGIIQLHAECIVYCCVYYGILHHINVITVKLF